MFTVNINTTDIYGTEYGKKKKMKSYTHCLAKTVRILVDWLALPFNMSMPLKLVHVSL